MTAAPPPAFAGDEIERYARHLVLAEVGGAGQQRLKRARVLVVGAGGLGSPVALYLAAAGIGTLGLVDDDAVSLSNLQRQILFSTGDVGRPKVEAGAEALRRLNPHVRVEPHGFRLDAGNADSLLSAYDVVADGSDNFATRYLVADRAKALSVPLVTAALGRFDGSVTVILPGAGHPSYRDLFPEPPPQGSIPTCAEAGILGAVAGVVGSLQALEVLKLVGGFGEPLVGRLLIYDALSQRFETIRYRRTAT